MSVLLRSCVVLCLSQLCGAQSVGNGACYSSISRSVGTTLYRSQSYTDTYSCGWFNLGRCTRTRYRTASSVVYSVQYVTQFGCCNGYSIDSGINQCSDINECDEEPCEHTCVNTVGSFECNCSTGFAINSNGLTCDDIDECASNMTQPCEHNCTNTLGSYNCSCNDGYVLNEDGHSCDATCDPDCENGGTCSAPNTCDCTDRYTGETCAQAICDHDCENGGTCSAPNTCDCTEGYTGDTCAQVTMNGNNKLNADNNAALGNQTSSMSDDAQTTLPYIFGGVAAGGVILLLLLLLVVLIPVSLRMARNKRKIPPAEKQTKRNKDEDFSNAVYYQPGQHFPAEPHKVTVKNKASSDHKVNLETSVENLYDEVGLHHIQKTSAVPDPDDMYDEIKLDDIDTTEDIYEEVDTANASTDTNVC